MILACEEHVEFAIDEFVDTYEIPPELRLVQETGLEGVDLSLCKFCGKPAKYLVTQDEE